MNVIQIVFTLCCNIYQCLKFLQDHLGAVLAKWTEYEQLLTECEQYIASDVKPWLDSQHGQTNDNLSQAQLQLNIAKVACLFCHTCILHMCNI